MNWVGSPHIPPDGKDYRCDTPAGIGVLGRREADFAAAEDAMQGRDGRELRRSPKLITYSKVSMHKIEADAEAERSIGYRHVEVPGRAVMAVGILMAVWCAG